MKALKLGFENGINIVPLHPSKRGEKLCTLESLLLYGSTLTRKILFQFGVAAGSKILNDPKTDWEHRLFILLSEQRRWFLLILENSVRQRSDKINHQDTWNEFNGTFLCQNFSTKLSPCLGLSPSGGLIHFSYQYNLHSWDHLGLQSFSKSFSWESPVFVNGGAGTLSSVVSHTLLLKESLPSESWTLTAIKWQVEQGGIWDRPCLFLKPHAYRNGKYCQPILYIQKC